jgi:spermidine synthase
VDYTRKHTVTQYQDPDYGWVGALDGRPLIFEHRFVASRTMTALAPLMINPAAKKVLLVGEEAGVYLATFVRLGGLELLVARGPREHCTCEGESAFHSRGTVTF